MRCCAFLILFLLTSCVNKPLTKEECTTIKEQISSMPNDIYRCNYSRSFDSKTETERNYLKMKFDGCVWLYPDEWEKPEHHIQQRSSTITEQTQYCIQTINTCRADSYEKTQTIADQNNFIENLDSEKKVCTEQVEEYQGLVNHYDNGSKAHIPNSTITFE